MKPETPATVGETRQQSTKPENQSETEPDDLIVVGIGASAGGLEALRGLLSMLPSDGNVAYIIAQHLAPTHRSLLIELLKTHTRMEVVEAKNRQELEREKIYVTPPGRNVTVSGARLKLTKTTGLVGPKPSVDQLFTSIAEDRRDRAVGIILSGTGSDGSAGVRAIKAHGGFTISQSVDSAKFDGMPHSAINSGNVDLVLPPERIGPELAELLTHPRAWTVTPPPTETASELERILQLILARTGCDFSDYKTNTVNRRIRRRMAINKLAVLEDYVRYVEQSPQETEDLCRDILVSVTSFFRDTDAYTALEDALKRIVETKQPGEHIRVWVPGCATGEEAYSIAILLDRLLDERQAEFFVQIFGTDLDENAILHARRGIYTATSLAGVSSDILKRYFVSTQNVYQVAKSIREMVVFARQDLVKDPPFSHLDLVSCRNLLIYFNNRLQKRVIATFHQVMEPTGYLFLGKSESITVFSELFEPVSRKWKVFRRRAVELQGFHDSDYPIFRTPTIRPPKRDNRDSRRSLGDVVNQAIADTHAPPAVLVDHRFQVRHVRDDVSPYLRLSSGDTDLNAVNMARDELRSDMRTLLYRVARDDMPLQSRRLRLQDGPDGRAVRLSARPVNGIAEREKLIAVMFEEERVDSDHELAVPVVNASADSRILELEKELVDAREQLQTTVEELETTNEELQSTNEELQSANEELQSSNEELETSNEELQSTNEEVRTVNEALQIKTAELAATNADVENVLSNMDFPLLVVNKDLRITRITPFALRLFDISPLDIGPLHPVGPVVTSVPCKVSLPTLRDDLVQVMQGEVLVEREVLHGGKAYWMRISPYYSEQKDTSGAIIMFLDRTRLLSAENELRRREARLTAIMDNFLYGIIAIGEDGVIENFNKAAERVFGYAAADVVGKDVSVLMPTPTRYEHSGYIQRYLETGESKIIGKGRRVTGLHKDGSPVDVELTIAELVEEDRRTFVGMFHALDELPEQA